jgi:DNA-binding NtrC family response regulator
LDCASLPKEGLQAEFLGGSGNFPSPASEERDIISTYRGTLFLDRIGDLTLDAQAVLLRAIYDQETRAVHDSRRAGGRLRILAATTRDLRLGVGDGTFRGDLYFRLNVLSLRVPSLRERRHDIPLLVGSFLYQFSNALGRQPRMSDEALKAMLMYDWPGNVRELESCVKHACRSAIESVIRLLDLPASIRETREVAPISFPNVPVVPLHELEKRSILETLLQVKGNRHMAAQLLGMDKTTLYRKLKEYGAQDRECN